MQALHCPDVTPEGYTMAEIFLFETVRAPRECFGSDRVSIGSDRVSIGCPSGAIVYPSGVIVCPSGVVTRAKDQFHRVRE